MFTTIQRGRHDKTREMQANFFVLNLTRYKKIIIICSNYKYSYTGFSKFHVEAEYTEYFGKNTIFMIRPRFS